MYTEPLAHTQVDASDMRGWTALHHAVHGGHKQLAVWLTEKAGATVGATTRGYRPLAQLHARVGRSVGLASGGSDEVYALAPSASAACLSSTTTGVLGQLTPAAAPRPAARPATAPPKRG